MWIQIKPLHQYLKMVIFVFSTLENKTLIFNLFSQVLVALEGLGQGLSIIDIIFCYTLNRLSVLQDHIQTNKLNFNENRWLVV